MKYFQQFISKNINAYWAISYTDIMSAVCYNVNDETGEITAITDIKVKSIYNSPHHPQIMIETLHHNVKINAFADHSHLVISIPEQIFLQAIGVL